MQPCRVRFVQDSLDKEFYQNRRRRIVIGSSEEKKPFDPAESEDEFSEKARENYYRYINYFPGIGILTSLALFILFFLIKGVEKQDYLEKVLYCLLPIVVYLLMYIPMKIWMKKSVR